MKGLIFVTCILFVWTVRSEPVSFITKCKSNDSKCMKESTKVAIPIFALGLPDLGVEPTDPINLKFINATTPNLKFLLHDVEVKGLKNCVPKKIQRDVENSKLIIKCLCDSTLDGQYELQGNLLFIQIEGKGKIHVDLRKAEFNIDADLIFKEGKDGKNHWNIKNWKFGYELKGKSDVKFENLFNGNDVLGRASKDLLEKSGNDIILEIGNPVIEAITKKVIQNINHFFKAVPYEDLSID